MYCTPRLNRIFGEDGKCIDIAIDHGVFNEPSFLDGIVDLKGTLEVIVDSNPDAIQLSPGSAPLLHEIRKRLKPALIIRTDTTNVYASASKGPFFSILFPSALEQALRLDAACVVVNLLLVPDETELYRQCITNVSTLKRDCERFGMPLMVEPLVMKPDRSQTGLGVDGSLDRIKPLVRQAVELGADIIKADPTDPLESYHEVIEVASGIPILVRGGERVSDEELLSRTYTVMMQGASGVVYGRNVIQHPIPDKMIRSLMNVVHHKTTPDVAMGEIRI